MENTVEAIATNNLLLIFAAIAITGIVLGKLSEIIKLPDVILYLLAGIIIGPSLLNLISVQAFPIENNLILTFGSAFILFEGGKEINLRALDKVKNSVDILATVESILVSIYLIKIQSLNLKKIIYDMGKKNRRYTSTTIRNNSFYESSRIYIILSVVFMIMQRTLII